MFGRGFGTGFVAAADWLGFYPLPHNKYLHVLVSGVIVGFLMGMVGIAIWFRRPFAAAEPQDREFLIPAILALAVYAVSDNVLTYPGSLASFAYFGVLLTQKPPRLAARSGSSQGVGHGRSDQIPSCQRRSGGIHCDMRTSSYGCSQRLELATRTLHCYAEGRDGDWEAICLDLDIAVQGGSFEEVFRSLREAIALYLESVAELPDAERQRLLRRSVPSTVRMKFVLNAVRSLLTREDGDTQHHQFTMPLAA